MKLIQTLRKLIMNSLGFSKTEANGFLLLLLTTILFAIVPRIYFNNLQKNKPIQDDNLANWVEELNASIQVKQTTVKKNDVAETTYSEFDPNLASIDRMISAGVPELIAKRISLYREKGGRFYKPEDIKKIYGLEESIAEKLIPFVSIGVITSDQKSITSYASYEPREKVNYSFDLNTTAAEELMLIKGIGSTLSQRIIKYRDRLGGFHSYDQLNEVYGLKPEVIDELRNHTTLASPITPLNMNSDSLKLLVRHPYIDYDLARIMINYRKVHGNFEDPSDLRNIKILSDSLYQKLIPYFSR